VSQLLGKFILSGIPTAPKSEQLINVMFEINDEGIVSTGGKKK
jgi:molecular chaperone DnaK (HSP70)